MGRIGLQGKVLQSVGNLRGGEQFIKPLRLVLLEPNGHDGEVKTMVLEPCERMPSLGVQALGAVAAEFHENTGTACLAADAVSLSVERFKVSAVGALVINEFHHCPLSEPCHLAPHFKLFIHRNDAIGRRMFALP